MMLLSIRLVPDAPTIQANIQILEYAYSGFLQPVRGVDDAAAGDRAGFPVLDAPGHCALHAHAGLQRIQQVQCLAACKQLSMSPANSWDGSTVRLNEQHLHVQSCACNITTPFTCP